MKILKGIAMYTLIAIGAVLCIGILLMGFMFLIPSFKLFGYGFVYNVKDVVPQTTIIHELDTEYKTETVNLNIEVTEGIGVRIEADQSDTANSIVSTVYSNYYGFYKGNRKLTVHEAKTSFNNATHTYNYSVSAEGVEGAINYSDKCVMVVKVPRKQLDGGNVQGGSENIKYNITVKTERGDIEIKGTQSDNNFLGAINVGSLNLTTTKGDLSLFGVGTVASGNAKPTSMVLDSFNISTKSGKFDFTSIPTTVNSALALSGEKADFLFDNLTINGKLEISGDNVLFSAKNLTTADSVSYQSVSGAFRVNEVLDAAGQVSVISENAQVTIGTAQNGELGVKTDYGNITVGTSKVTTYLHGGHGNVVVDKCEKGLEIHTTYGDITAKDYSKSAVFSTNRGKVVANSTYAGDDVAALVTRVRLNGKAQLDLTTNKVPFDVTSTDNSTVNITVKDVVTGSAVYDGDYVSTVNLAKGTLNVNMVNTKPLVIKATGAVSGSAWANPSSLESGHTYRV
ncbi:MAG: hypothetical protein IK070_01435, partial [Clostridia bacterium]|nr:hypothetical protein [Clostridia bacterium]